jgi:hypothetical protein
MFPFIRRAHCPVESGIQAGGPEFAYPKSNAAGMAATVGCVEGNIRKILSRARLRAMQVSHWTDSPILNKINYLRNICVPVEPADSAWNC